jgi:hypothetical protein
MVIMGLSVDMDINVGIQVHVNTHVDGEVLARIGAELLVRSVAALESSSDSARTDDELIRVVQPPEHVIDRHVWLLRDAIEEGLLDILVHDAVSSGPALRRLSNASIALKLKLLS